MKILVFGETGQLARELLRRGDVEIETAGRSVAEFTDPETCAEVVEATDADAVINAVAYTAVDKAEEDEATAMMVNAIAPAAIARAAAARGIPLVHVSTDYVFDGSGDQPFSVDAPTGPLGVYGKSKLAGEDAIRASGANYAILRTSWVVSAHGHNFVKTMLRLGAERDQLTIVADEIGGPTPAAALADSCIAVARAITRDPSKSGTYHVSGTPNVSWASFAKEIFSQAEIDCDVVDISSADYPTPAMRPLNSRLDNSLTEATFGFAQPDWRKGLADILMDLGAAEREQV